MTSNNKLILCIFILQNTIFTADKVENFLMFIVLTDSGWQSENTPEKQRSKKDMQTAKNLPLSYNPIDIVENIFSTSSYELERRNLNEVVIEVQGKWNNMLLFFAWEASMQCLHLSCLMDIESTIEDRSKIFELLAMVNEELWVGHFSYWAEQKMPVFKHSILLNSDEGEVFESKLSQVIDIAIKECERMYPIFKVVLTKGMSPQQALYPMMMETVGQA